MITIQKIDKTEVSPSGNTILAEFRGLSTDTKPTTTGGKDIENGSMFIEIDTGKIYLFDKSGSQWVEMIGGGSEPNLQDKTVTITENTTTTITADTGYDALGSVAVTTNIPVTDWTQLGYTEEPDCFQTAFNYAKAIRTGWNSNRTDCSSLYSSNYNLLYFPAVDTSKVTNVYQMFSGCGALQKVPELDLKKVTNFMAFCRYCRSLKEIGDIESTSTSSITLENAFASCDVLETAPMIKMAGSTSFYGTFSSCSKLKNVPQFQFNGGISSMVNAFNGCTSLTDTSLNNIMGAIKTAPSFSGTKTLKSIGLTEAQATTCTSLSNWTDLQTAGWTTGY